MPAAVAAVALAVLLSLLGAGCRAQDAPAGPEPSTAAAAPASPSPSSPPAPVPGDAASAAARAEGGPPAVAADAGGLAAQLAAAEQRIRDESVPLAALAGDGHLQQSAYRALARNPGWRDEVLARLPAHLRAPARANANAVADLVAMITPLPAGSRPGWRIVAPAPAHELLGFYREAGAEYGIGWEYLAAIHLVETRLGRIRGTSSAGAQGPMQFMPGTWAQYGEGDVDDDRDAIRAAARYLKAMGGPADMDRALRRYNDSARYVRAIQAHAAVLRAEPSTYRGYYHWQVHYLTQEGDLWLPEGYPERPAVVPPA